MDGEYPTDEDLERIKKWPFDDLDAGLEFVQSIWRWPDFGIAKGNGVLYLATGGWSGNEHIIGAMKENVGFWCRWICSTRGGAHEFDLHAKAPHHETRFALEARVLALLEENKKLREVGEAWNEAKEEEAGRRSYE